MRIGIAGLPQSGKKTLFELLTGIDASSTGRDGNGSIPGVADIRDVRCDALAEMYKPKKHTPARIDIELLPDLDKRLIQEGKIFRDIANLDALCLVVRDFEDDAVYHVNGSVDPVRDINEITGELALHDLVFIEKRIERIDLDIKKGKGKHLLPEKALLEKLQSHLEKDLPLRTFELSGDNAAIISGYPFITLKQMVVALNIDDAALGGNGRIETTGTQFASQKMKFMQISVKLESEIALLETEEERAEFMESSGIGEPAINTLSRLCMSALGLKSFFTVGADEVRQWLVLQGSCAPKAARVIHSDIERGFIRAEVMKYEDLRALKTEAEVKRAGRYYTMGKEYVIEDGDIVSFLFNV